MRWNKTLPTLTGVVLLAAACSGEATDEMSMEEEMADAPIIEVAAGECYLQGATLEEATTTRPSPLNETEFAYQGGSAKLCYGAPSANEREVMGTLVPFGDLWRAGANEPTALHLTGPASVGGVSLEAGSYAIYAAPGADEWEFFINSNFERWGIPISDEVRATELGSFTAATIAIDERVETLRYSFDGDADNTMGDIVLEWENTQVRFHVHPAG